MTDTVETVEPVVAKPRPVRRAKPAPRAKAHTETITLTRAELKNLVGDAVAEAVAPVQDQLDQLKGGQPQFTRTEPPPPPRARQAAPEELTEFEARMVAKTAGRVLTPKPQQSYNYANRWFARPDGDIVSLQGSPDSRALYADMGFHCLNDEEAQEWQDSEMAKAVAQQRTEAAMITGLRKLVRREAVLAGYEDDLAWDGSLNTFSVDRLREEWHNLCRQTNNPDRRYPTAERYREEPDPKAGLLAGMETSHTTSLEELQAKLSADGSHARTVATEFEMTTTNWNQAAHSA